MKRTSLNGYIYDFSVEYDATNIDDIKDIHKYLMKKVTLYKSKYLDLFKKHFHRINNFIRFWKCKFNKCNSTELYFNEKSRM